MATNIVTKRQHMQQYLQSFNFKDLFRELLGWDTLKERPVPITCDNDTYLLHPLVEKCGMKVYVCDPDAAGHIPADPILRKIESELTKHAYEHIIIYVDAARTRQVWQWVKRGQGKSQQRLNRYYKGHSGDLLAQKLERLEVAITEEDHVHIAEMVGCTVRAFDVERVTRRFYERFKLEHAAFLQCIHGIVSQTDREWYTSLMLNRLMFIYFIQRKGFLDTKTPGALDGDTNYLSNRLKWVQEQYGKDQFHTFYRYFLLKLFHDGLRTREHSPELERLLGKVPYLNGGLFDIHTLEQAYPAINIPDEAFKKLFDFFDEFDWYLDDRPLHNDREINPDVLGYIFEKYINQKQMGAYYTKEDITEYISKNTIVPCIFAAAEQKCLMAFKPDGPVWSLLRVDPDRYIYDAVKKGCTVPLPPEIEAGVHDVTQRGEWNTPAPEPYALPTEIWREVVVRRTRYQDVKAKLAAGEITSIDDLITYNLDIVTFVEDAISYCEGSDLLRAFYDSIRTVTVLDPTCGSGAFLFAALAILECLYEACLDRMQQMIEEQDLLAAALLSRKWQQHTKLDYFRDILRAADKHPSRKYFIYKSIIINNLYGVDIMAEATEICKLCLFLKLVSQVEQFNHIEPLPDIDFNIRAGNTLVGFASYEEMKRVIEGKTVGRGSTRDEAGFQNQVIFDDRLVRIEQKAQEIERAFEHFRKLQTELPLDPANMAMNKQLLCAKLGALRTELDCYLALEYGIDRDNSRGKGEYDEKFARWQQSHQPFHWWVEFYGIMKRGGFDVIIGNPPYVEYYHGKFPYSLQNYETLRCANLYTCIIERSHHLLSTRGSHGMILPLAAFATRNMVPLIQSIQQWFPSSWISFYHFRPSMLFSGGKAANIPTTIYIVNNQGKYARYSTNVLKWLSEHRGSLFTSFSYCQVTTYQDTDNPHYYPKYGTQLENTLMEKVFKHTRVAAYLDNLSFNNAMYYRSAGGLYWKVFINFPWPYQTTSNKQCAFRIGFDRDVFVALFNSSLFWWYYTVAFDTFNLKDYMIFGFRFSYPQDVKMVEELKHLCYQLMKDYKVNAKHLKRGKTGSYTVYARHSKSIIDEIDRVLAKHYGVTDEELDFIINYDIKYRDGARWR